MYININTYYTSVQSQNAVSAYFSSKQILPFGFVEQYRGIIQSYPSWNISISTTYVNKSKYLDILNSIFSKLGRRALETMHFSYVRSILVSADILFGNPFQVKLGEIDSIRKRDDCAMYKELS